MSLRADISHDDYHAKRGLYMTSHLLIAAHRSMADFITDFRSPKGDSDALYFGRASHVYTLEGPDKFHAEYTIGGPVNPRTGKTYGTKSKAFQEWANEQPKPAVTPEEFQQIQRMAESVYRLNAAQQLLADGEAEVSGRCEIEQVPCQARLDWLTRCNRIVDYKTTNDLATIAIAAEQYGYLIQQAFYRQVVRELTGHTCRCYLIWCEKSDSAGSVVWELQPELLDQQEQKNKSMISEVREVFFKLRKEKLCQQQSAASSTTSMPSATNSAPAAMAEAV